MKCYWCDGFDLNIICAKCQRNFLQPTLQKQQLITDFFVYSFFEYEQIKDLIYSKYDAIGSRIYAILAKWSMRHFALNFDYPHLVNAIGLDYEVKRGYVHSALLLKALRSPCILPVYGALRPQSQVSYANQSYAFRLLNPRQFVLHHTLQCNEVILVDDVVTSGLSLLEAKDVLKRSGIEVLFALALCNNQNSN